MARTVPDIGSSGRSIGSRSANQPTHGRAAHTRALAGSGAKKAAQLELLVAAQELSDRVTDTRADSWAYRYLESSRLLVPPPAPLDPAEQHKLAGEQADTMVDVLWAVLDGLGLTQEQHDRGLDLAIKALQEAAGPGWEPL